jgi:DNA-binding MarR family transcriptional regulator
MSLSAARLDEQLCFALYSASSRLTAIYRPILETMDLTYPQFVVMMALWECDQISITELAKRTGQSNATLTPLLTKLEDKTLLTLARLQGNDRQKCISLTTQGKRLGKKSLKASEQAFCASGLTLEEAQTMIALCGKLGRKTD